MSGLLQAGTPGVYVQIVPSGVRTITGVATSVTAFVGRTSRGNDARAVEVSSWEQFSQDFGGLWAESELGYALYHFFQNGGSRAVVARVTRSAGTARVDLPAVDGSTMRLSAANAGDWGNRLRVSVSHGTPGAVDELVDPNDLHLTVEEMDADPTNTTPVVVETYDRLSVQPDAPRYIGRVLETQSALLRLTTDATARPNAVTRAALSQGNDGAVGDDTAYQAALDRLLDAPDVNLICIPPPAADLDTSTNTWAHALTVADARRAMLVYDPPLTWGDSTAALGFTARAENVVVYYPRIRALDPLRDNLVRSFAPCGAVCGVIARTDAERGIWKAPAGQDARLVGVTGFEDDVDQAAAGSLNERGVNVLRELRPAGRVVNGARTSMGADALGSEWKYLSVRRTALFIAETLHRSTQWAVFEPNDEPLWAQLRLAVGTFMNDLFRKGAFAGKKPRDAFRVRCDAATTTQADIDRGIVNMHVAFAPLHPAEFVVLKIQQLAGGN